MDLDQRSTSSPTATVPVVTTRHPSEPAVVVSTDTRRLDVDLIHDFLANESYWAEGVPREVVERAIEHSLAFGLHRGDRQIGFARLITDQATFGYLSDVFVVRSERGAGLGAWLVEQVLAHPVALGLRRITLGTRDAQPLYAKLGFSLSNPTDNMEIRRVNAELYGSRD
jgi:GNAT superfamily N-acetyltransferase